MEIKSLTAGLSVSEQIKPTDIQEIKDAGFRAIICNRPDGEGVDQPTFEEIAKAAKKLGIKTSYLPIVSGKVSDDDAAALESELTKLPGPILAFCRTGTRSATLWSLAQVKHRSVADILAATKAAGYDMGVVMRRIVNGADLNIVMIGPLNGDTAVERAKAEAAAAGVSGARKVTL